MDRFFFTAGGIAAFVGVALGAFGAHSLRERLTPDMLNIFEVGVRYQMYHALGLVAVGVMDLMDDQRAAAIPPILAFIFAAWNGYGSWSSLSQILSARQAGHDRSSPPEERR